MSPKTHDVFRYRQSIEVGELASEDKVWFVLRKLMKKYKANGYDMLKQNCNTFTNEFLVALLGRGLPGYLNRAAYIGSYFHCIVPKRYLVVTPKEEVDASTGQKKTWDSVDTDESLFDDEYAEDNNEIDSGDSNSDEDALFMEDGNNSSVSTKGNMSSIDVKLK